MRKRLLLLIFFLLLGVVSANELDQEVNASVVKENTLDVMVNYDRCLVLLPSEDGGDTNRFNRCMVEQKCQAYGNASEDCSCLLKYWETELYLSSILVEGKASSEQWPEFDELYAAHTCEVIYPLEEAMVTMPFSAFVDFYYDVLLSEDDANMLEGATQDVEFFAKGGEELPIDYSACFKSVWPLEDGSDGIRFFGCMIDTKCAAYGNTDEACACLSTYWNTELYHSEVLISMGYPDNPDSSDPDVKQWFEENSCGLNYPLSEMVIKMPITFLYELMGY